MGRPEQLENEVRSGGPVAYLWGHRHFRGMSLVRVDGVKSELFTGAKIIGHSGRNK